MAKFCILYLILCLRSVDDNENLLVCDGGSHKVFLVTKGGKEVCEFLTEKDGDGQLASQ